MKQLKAMDRNMHWTYRVPQLRGIFLICCLLAFGTVASYADTLTETFNQEFAWDSSIDSWGMVSIAPVGQITLTTNSNGTISATVTADGLPEVMNDDGVLVGGQLEGVWWNSEANWMFNYGFSGVTPDSPESGLGGGFGGLNSGFCNNTGLGTGVSWTIGVPGSFTSVWQILGGTDPWTGVESVDDFMLQDTSYNYYGAGSPPYFAAPPPTNDPTTTPEPSSLLLLGTGVLGVAGAIKRKLVR